MTAAPANSTRLAVVLSHPTQYYSPWFRWLRANTPLEFRVFYLWEFGVTAQRDPKFQTTFKWDVDLLSGYEHEFVPNTARDPGTHRFGGLRNPTLTARLAAWRPAAVLMFGYNFAAHLRAIAWARRRGIPLIFRGDSHLMGRGAPRPWVALALRILYAQFAAFPSVGAANRDYYRGLGVPERKLFFSPHSVNAALFDPDEPSHRDAAEALRRRLGLAPETRVVLFAGKLVPDKQPRELLQAFLSLQPADTTLVIVGEGPEKTALQEIARTAPAGAVHFLPFANQSEMPATYLLADLFVLPARGHYETWGLAVNEAMHMGTPALVSDLVGCQRDLVTDGETGWVFQTGRPDALKQKLAAALGALARPAERSRIRQNVATRIAGYTYAQTSAGLLEALASLPPPRHMSSNR
ncbi:MAG TPA: glycosyltransferase family 4 protein [Opitutaceae bacterium]|nr:glycosyltransferase family 4 protein [Opitutaceae bacterium]